MAHENQQPNYEKLRIWQESMSLVETIYYLAQKFPKEEQFGITSQLQRAAVSVPTNIAEGHGKSSKADFKRFLSISKGSLQEVNTLLQIAVRMNYLPQDEYGRIREQILSLVRQITSLMKSLSF